VLKIWGREGEDGQRKFQLGDLPSCLLITYGIFTIVLKRMIQMKEVVANQNSDQYSSGRDFQPDRVK
jgi:hypothetical protein